MTDGRARFSVIKIEQEAPSSKLRLSTRRGKQFNSMVHRDLDPLTGARRERADEQTGCQRIGCRRRRRFTHKSRGADAGALHVCADRSRQCQVHWPEGNVLIERGISDPECGIPDFNTEVEIERIT
jgi:hypothetical protein